MTVKNCELAAFIFSLQKQAVVVVAETIAPLLDDFDCQDRDIPETGT